MSTSTRVQQLQLGDEVIYDRTWIAAGVKNNSDLEASHPAEGEVVRVGKPYDSGHYNVDIRCRNGLWVYQYDLRATEDWKMPTDENPVVVTAPAEYCVPLKPWRHGRTFDIDVNHGMRPAMICGRIGLEIVVEYEMPKGTTALRIVHIPNCALGRTISYKKVPKKWVEAIDDGIGMHNLKANPQ